MNPTFVHQHFNMATFLQSLGSINQGELFIGKPLPVARSKLGLPGCHIAGDQLAEIINGVVVFDTLPGLSFKFWTLGCQRIISVISIISITSGITCLPESQHVDGFISRTRVAVRVGKCAVQGQCFLCNAAHFAFQHGGLAVSRPGIAKHNHLSCVPTLFESVMHQVDGICRVDRACDAKGPSESQELKPVFVPHSEPNCPAACLFKVDH